MTRRTFSTDIKNILHDNSTNAYEAELFSGDKITFDNAENNDNLKNLVIYLNRNYYECHERTVSNALTVAYYLTFKHFDGNNDIVPENEIFDYFMNAYKKVSNILDKDLKLKQVYAFDGCVIKADGSVKHVGFSDNFEGLTSDRYYQGEKVRKFNRLQAEMFANRYSSFYHKPCAL